VESQTTNPTLNPFQPAIVRLQSLAPVMLVAVLAVAILTEGLFPDVWTKSLLAIGLPLDLLAALWLTRPRE
jgi:hypothetical protein